MPTLRPLIPCLLVLSSFASAQVNPTSAGIGSHSSTASISITRGNSASGIRISNLNDFDFGLLSGDEVSRQDAICIYASSGIYEITTFSLNNNGAQHQLKDDSGETNTFIDYNVAWDDLQGAGFTNLLHGETLTNLAGADTSDLDCASGTTAQLQITIKAVDFLGATFGTLYTDTLTITAGIL